MLICFFRILADSIGKEIVQEIQKEISNQEQLNFISEIEKNKLSIELISITPNAIGVIESAARTCYQRESKGEYGDLVKKLIKSDGCIYCIRRLVGKVKKIDLKRARC